jgi:hypothetical protein
MMAFSSSSLRSFFAAEIPMRSAKCFNHKHSGKPDDDSIRAGDQGRHSDGATNLRDRQGKDVKDGS